MHVREMEKQNMIKPDVPIPQRIPSPPDGGYGWVIVFARFLQFGVMVQLVPNYQILFGPKFDQWDASPTERSSVLGVFMTMMTIISVFVGPLGQASSERVVAIIGTSLQVLGLVISALATSTPHLILGFSVLCGLGTGVIAINSVFILNKYFRAKVSLAIGLSGALVSVSGLVIPQLLRLLLERLVIERVILVYSAVTAVLAFTGSALFKPIQSYSAVSQQREGEDVKKDCNHYLNVTRKFFVKIFTDIEWSLMKSPYFLFITSANSILMTVFMVQISEIAQVARARHFSAASIANIVTALCSADVFTRFISGWMMDLGVIKRLFPHPVTALYMINGLVMAILMLGLALAKSVEELMVLVCLVSFANSNTTISYTQILR